MSETPETDAELHGIKAVCKDEYMLDQMAEFARKLERERDEAREHIAELRYIADTAIEYIGHTAVRQKLRYKFNQLKELRNE
jgi:hypothetical protein